MEHKIKEYMHRYMRYIHIFYILTEHKNRTHASLKLHIAIGRERRLFWLLLHRSRYLKETVRCTLKNIFGHDKIFHVNFLFVCFSSFHV